jgi:murein DD-endopeptidase MepM/ murein hydrolase activator NlpD
MKRPLILLAILVVGMAGPLWAETTLFESGWENGQVYGHADSVAYSREVAGYFNSSSPPPECSRRYHEQVHNGDYALMVAGYSGASYAYCYYRVFDEDIEVVEGMKLGYWIYHARGTAKVAVDGHFKDGRTIRDFGGGALTDQNGVRIHPALRNDPMNRWHYVEVDLSPAAGRTIDFLMVAFDNGGDGFTGQYRAYVDDLRVFMDDVGMESSLTNGRPKGAFGSGGQTDEVTEPETWRWSEWFYGHQGIDLIAWKEVCGERHTYAMGWHQGDLIEYLMKFGGDYDRLVLRGIADRPGPVELQVFVDGVHEATAYWDHNDDCNQDVAVKIPDIPYGTHAIAVRFANDKNDSSGDRNFYLDGLRVEKSEAASGGGWSFPVGDAESGAGWYVTNPLGNSWQSGSGIWYKGHLGEDWFKDGGSYGEPVYAAAAGRVVILRPDCGNYLDIVIIEHTVEGIDEPVYSFYGHIQADGFVQEGDWVEKRQQLGVIGDPVVFFPHLHFEIKNRTALLNPPFSNCTIASKGWYISAGYSGIADDYDGGDYYDPSDEIDGNRYYHPTRFIRNHGLQ